MPGTHVMTKLLLYQLAPVSRTMQRTPDAVLSQMVSLKPPSAPYSATPSRNSFTRGRPNHGRCKLPFQHT